MKNRTRALATVIFLAVAPFVGSVFWDRESRPSAQSLTLPETPCQSVQGTPLFSIAYGAILVNDLLAPEGTVVEARSPRGNLAGCFVISEPGHYGAMYIYGEDSTVDPAIPGMRPGEEVAFSVKGVVATSESPLVWTNDHDLHLFEVRVYGGWAYLPLVMRAH